jgi:hypothetical protein
MVQWNGLAVADLVVVAGTIIQTLYRIVVGVSLVKAGAAGEQ